MTNGGAGPQGGGAGSGGGGSTGSGGSTGGGGSTGTAGAGGSSSCPATQPSGACTDSTLECRYVDAKGCPQLSECFEYLGSASWTSLIPDPGGACAMPEQLCTYEEAIGDNLPTYGALKCGASGKWEQSSVCPATIPKAGDSCNYTALSCSYQGCGGTKSVLAYCNGPKDGWQIEPCPDAGP
jgi:hypothetical protein